MTDGLCEMSLGSNMPKKDGWECSLCTFKNHTSNTACEMCDMPKGPGTTGTRRPRPDRSQLKRRMEDVAVEQTMALKAFAQQGRKRKKSNYDPIAETIDKVASSPNSIEGASTGSEAFRDSIFENLRPDSSASGSGNDGDSKLSASDLSDVPVHPWSVSEILMRKEGRGVPHGVEPANIFQLDSTGQPETIVKELPRPPSQPGSHPAPITSHVAATIPLHVPAKPDSVITPASSYDRSASPAVTTLTMTIPVPHGTSVETVKAGIKNTVAHICARSNAPVVSPAGFAHAQTVTATSGHVPPAVAPGNATTAAPAGHLQQVAAATAPWFAHGRPISDLQAVRNAYSGRNFYGGHN